MSYSPWGCKELDTTEVTKHTHAHTWQVLVLRIFCVFGHEDTWKETEGSVWKISFVLDLVEI